MKRYYLGIDTSNYRTSAALYAPEDGSWENRGRLLDVPEGTIGLRQSDAVFQHSLHLHEMIAALPAGIAGEIEAVGVSIAPRAVSGSYMPCFLVGQNMAAGIAHILGVPLYVCSHQIGHVAAAALSAGVLDWLAHAGFLRLARIGRYDRTFARVCRTRPWRFALCGLHRRHQRFGGRTAR